MYPTCANEHQAADKLVYALCIFLELIPTKDSKSKKCCVHICIALCLCYVYVSTFKDSLLRLECEGEEKIGSEFKIVIT